MKKWLTENYLPMWAKQTVLSENRQLRRENDRLILENRELRAYIRGLRTGLRKSGHSRRNNGGEE